jgi:hypothetical protein
LQQAIVVMVEQATVVVMCRIRMTRHQLVLMGQLITHIVTTILAPMGLRTIRIVTTMFVQTAQLIFHIVTTNVCHKEHKRNICSVQVDKLVR